MNSISGWTAARRVTSVQYSGRGGGPTRSPHVRGEHVVEHQHRHVATDAVGLVADVDERVDRRLREGRGERVELGHVGPRREVRVAAAGDDAPSPTARNALGVRSRSSTVARTKYSGCSASQGWSGATWFGHEVDDEPHAPLGQRRAGARPAPSRPPNRGRPRSGGCSTPSRCTSAGVKSGRASAEVGQLGRRLERQPDPRRAAPPHAHQPHGVDARRRDASPTRRRGTSPSPTGPPAPARRPTSSSHTAAFISYTTGPASPVAPPGRGSRPVPGRSNRRTPRHPRPKVTATACPARAPYAQAAAPAGRGSRGRPPSAYSVCGLGQHRLGQAVFLWVGLAGLLRRRCDDRDLGRTGDPVCSWSPSAWWPGLGCWPARCGAGPNPARHRHR